MVDDGAARTYVNRIRLVFRWGVEEGLVSAAVLEGLRAVAPLKRGRFDARESDAVRPVPQATIDKVLPHLGRQVAALVRLQLLMAARPGELLKLRPIDFDTSGPVWTATLDLHKTQHHGRERVLYFGPKAIEIVRGFMSSASSSSQSSSSSSSSSSSASSGGSSSAGSSSVSGSVSGSGSGSSNCQLHGTLITMADGRRVPIESLAPGDVVQSLSVPGLQTDVPFRAQYEWLVVVGARWYSGP